MISSGRYAGIVVVDDPDSIHAATVRRACRLAAGRVPCGWVLPDLLLPQQLAALAAAPGRPPPAAVCLPLAVRGATPDDLFTRELIRSIGLVGRAGVQVFVAVGSRRTSNLLAEAPGAVSVGPIRREAGRPRHAARLRC